MSSAGDHGWSHRVLVGFQQGICPPAAIEPCHICTNRYVSRQIVSCCCQQLADAVLCTPPSDVHILTADFFRGKFIERTLTIKLMPTGMPAPLD